MRRNKLQVPVTLITMIAIALIIAMSGCGQGSSSSNGGDDAAKVGIRGVLHKKPEIVEPEVTPTEEQLEKKEVAERLDTHDLLYTAKVVVDKDEKMLEAPEHIAPKITGEWSIAKEAPEVEFAIIPVEPMWLGEPPVKSKSDIPNTSGPWSNWSQANFDSRTGKFYSAVGDHGKYNAHIFLVEYDPDKREVSTLPEVNKVLGRTQDQFMEGKIHGWLDFYKAPYLDKEHLWYCTYWAKYPEPDEEDYATGYTGGHIMSYDVMTGDIVDYGVPMERASWPYHRVDTVNGIMYAVGMFSEFLAWDIDEQKTKWAGYLPPGMKWNNRAILIDETTGMVYTSNHDTEVDPERHIIKYDPFRNRHYLMESHMPVTTGESNRGATGGISAMRAQTRQRDDEGLFWAVTSAGQNFTFSPDEDEIVDKGPNWVGVQRYTTSMDMSPDGKYVYYLPGAHGHGYSDGSPVVQWNTETNEKKVLAFMFPYYYEKYGYTPGGTFSIKLNDAGDKLFVLWNGAFIDHEDGHEGDTFGHCSVMVITIPESERM